MFAADPETITDTPDSYKKRTSAAAAKYLTQVKDAAAAVGVTCAVIDAEHEHPYKAIIDAANKNGCGLIAMASILPMLGAQMGMDFGMVSQVIASSTSAVIDAILRMTGNL